MELLDPGGGGIMLIYCGLSEAIESSLSWVGKGFWANGQWRGRTLL
jgi:hypothetical protein